MHYYYDLVPIEKTLETINRHLQRYPRLSYKIKKPLRNISFYADCIKGFGNKSLCYGHANAYTYYSFHTHRTLTLLLSEVRVIPSILTRLPCMWYRRIMQVWSLTVTYTAIANIEIRAPLRVVHIPIYGRVRVVRVDIKIPFSTRAYINYLMIKDLANTLLRNFTW